jgi:hypothetical protein
MSNEHIETPRASHVSDTDLESESDTEYLDADQWFEWFKTTDEYKAMKPVEEKPPDLSTTS